MPQQIEGEVDLYPITVTYEFPENTFVENIAVRRSGELLVTVFWDGAVYHVDPSRKDRKAALIHRFPGSGVGIVEVEPDIFYVSHGVVSQKGTFAVHRVDMRQFSAADDGTVDTPAVIDKVADVPDAAFLNGSTVLDREKGIILVADSFDGSVYAVNTKTSTVSVWFHHQLLEKVSTDPEVAGHPALNGIKLREGYIYLSNTEGHNFFRIKVDRSGQPSGELEVLQENLSADDFAFDRHGNAYLTTHEFNSLVKLSADGTRSRVAGGADDAMFAGPTAAAFGRTENDRTASYVVTEGGIVNPVNGSVGTGKILRVEVGVEGDGL